MKKERKRGVNKHSAQRVTKEKKKLIRKYVEIRKRIMKECNRIRNEQVLFKMKKQRNSLEERQTSGGK